MTGGKGTPFLPSSSLTRSPLHRPGSADIYLYINMFGKLCRIYINLLQNHWEPLICTCAAKVDAHASGPHGFP